VAARQGIFSDFTINAAALGLFADEQNQPMHAHVFQLDRPQGGLDLLEIGREDQVLPQGDMGGKAALFRRLAKRFERFVHHRLQVTQGVEIASQTQPEEAHQIFVIIGPEIRQG